MKCLVSGATGFIGRRLCQQLAARGDSVVALSKSGAKLPGDIATHAIDLAKTMPPSELLQGVEVVYHLAGIAHQRAEQSVYRQLNEVATLQLARLAAAAGARRFVFLSSVKAMGPATADSERPEQDCNPATDPYGLSKWRAECALREEFSAGPMTVCILRPALVYGPGAKGNLALLARAMQAGLPRPPALGGRSMIALDDLVELLCVAASAPCMGVQTWLVTDGQRYTTRDIYDQMRRAAGRGTGPGWLPVPGWRLAAALLDLVAGGGSESTFEKLFGTELYSNRALLQATGWHPRLGLQDVVADMLATGPARR